MALWAKKKFSNLFGPALDPSTLMCLNCRRSGHLKRQCTEPRRASFDFQSTDFLEDAGTLKPTSNVLCRRCEGLNILSFFEGDIGWEDRATLYVEQLRGHAHYKLLGSAGSAQFFETCPLCVCLFVLSPNPRDLNTKLHVIADWTIHHIDLWIRAEPTTRGSYDKCIAVVETDDDGQVSVRSRMGNALGLMRGETESQPLGVRLVDQRELNVEWMKSCIASCKSLHPFTCGAKESAGLATINLIDIQARKTIPYPGSPCEYLTLSYVWGGVVPVNYRLGDAIQNVPQTIEDAMSLTHMLGQRYLWVDYLCIPQDDQAERLRQINQMSSIYEGAYACIVAISATSMDGGLSRVQGSKRKSQPQFSCMVGGQRLVSIMPMLGHQIGTSVWSTRSWTLQETFLSSRNFYISDHQVYFECNAMQCCESLDETKSWVHQSFREREFLDSDSDELAYIYGRGESRKPFPGLRTSGSKQRWETWHILLSDYLQRYMTNDDDAIAAFTGILNYFTDSSYPSGFFWGHPREDFDRSLLWTGVGHFERRSDRFPAWSWSGWKGKMKHLAVVEDAMPRFPWTHFFAWGATDGILQLIFPHDRSDKQQQQHGMLFSADTKFDKISDLPCEQQNHELCVDELEKRGHILLDCAICKFDMTVDRQYDDGDITSQTYYFVVVAGINCVFQSSPTNFRYSSGQKISFENVALVARSRRKSMIIHYFFQLTFDRDGYGAKSNLCFALHIPRNQPAVIEDISITRRKFVMK